MLFRAGGLVNDGFGLLVAAFWSASPKKMGKMFALVATVEYEMKSLLFVFSAPY